MRTLPLKKIVAAVLPIGFVLAVAATSANAAAVSSPTAGSDAQIEAPSAVSEPDLTQLSVPVSSASDGPQGPMPDVAGGERSIPGKPQLEIGIGNRVSQDDSTDDTSSVQAPTIAPSDGGEPETSSENNEGDTDRITSEMAGRIKDARQRLDTLIAARDAGPGLATPNQIALAKAAEAAAEAAFVEAGVVSWHAQRYGSYWEEIQDVGLKLPAGIIDYKLEKARPMHERDAMPRTSIEILPRLVYATQTKNTYSDFDSYTPIPNNDIKPNDTFLSIGLVRKPPSGRRVIGWVLGRGQVIVTENDISQLNPEN